MLKLRRATIEKILEELNFEENIAAFVSSPAWKHRADWENKENHPLDTSGMGLRLEMVDWMTKFIKTARSKEVYAQPKFDSFKLTPLVKVADFYYYSDTKGNVATLAQEHFEESPYIHLPLAAFLITGHLFYFDFTTSRWDSREWMEEDPMLRLPYSRKYDFERAVAHDNWRKRMFEGMSICDDLISIYIKRIEKASFSDIWEEMTWPELQDIQNEMQQVGFALGNGGLLGLTAGIDYELLEVRSEFNSSKQTWVYQPIYPALVEGSYHGVLSESRHPHGSSVKYMTILALQRLQNNIYEALSQEEDQELITDTPINEHTKR